MVRSEFRHLPHAEGAVTLHFSLETRLTRAATAGFLMIASGGLCVLVLADFLVGALTLTGAKVRPDAGPAAFIITPFSDDRVAINPNVLAAVARYMPNSPRLQMKLSRFEIAHSA